ncbi:nitroreductase/quinone reductase family protein [Actinacidiphila guanduensis]|jgi:deazaflavin-dependent oxidoreductase (nitroreductase family)|uniref:Deazaflavin-dependent oxidoreductase, nitroreductase family n=1 Tax=Actinacidiphila guanduensis TaxID=310781 RepID=A0A1H0MDG5_9ACTN|nr:nitroreductase/quinone reductase family protein [Actinacidiphila guanduensis]SDO78488.1 deazaflavin-dependent oxidoreductase, nitroreductase family [Actinacidiphila guanduensis]
MPVSWKERNAEIIADFRKNGGKISPGINAILAQVEVVLITMKGAKSGAQYVVPLTCFPLEEGDFFVVASAGGAPRTPSWYHNLKAHPDVLIERGIERYPAVATLVEDPTERAHLYAQTTRVRSEFADYERKAGRLIPVFIVRRKPERDAN